MNQPDNAKPALQCIKICKSYQQGGHEVAVLDGLDLTLARGERLAVLGASGSGKSTLLNILGGLDDADSGRVKIDGVDFSQIGEKERCRVRNQKLGFVYQFHHLLPEFTAIENAAMPLMIGGKKRREAEARAGELLDAMGLSHRYKHRPAALSGGERQRVAIARALVNQPVLVLMDEPTGNLDEGSAHSVVELIDSLSKQLSTAFVMVTHDRDIAGLMDRQVLLEGHRLHEQKILEKSESAGNIEDTESTGSRDKKVSAGVASSS